MSPSTSQTLPQDPFRTQEPPRVETSVGPENSSTQCKEEETLSSAPKQEEFDVKDEPESLGLGEGATSQPRQPSMQPPERSNDPEVSIPYEGTRTGLSQAPWTYVMNELRSVQFASEQFWAFPDLFEIADSEDSWFGLLVKMMRSFEGF